MVTITLHCPLIIPPKPTMSIIADGHRPVRGTSTQHSSAKNEAVERL
jgi:hypothetical protein